MYSLNDVLSRYRWKLDWQEQNNFWCHLAEERWWIINSEDKYKGTPGTK